MTTFKFNKEKTVAALLFIANRLREVGVATEMHAVFKILYFAERKHLARYARPITGDTYKAMEYGPVPSESYSLLNWAKGPTSFLNEEIKKYFEVLGYYINPLQAPDMDEFSDSDVWCLNEAIEENKFLNFGERTAKSHGSAWIKTERNRAMDFCDIAAEEGATADTCEMIKMHAENEWYAEQISS